MVVTTIFAYFLNNLFNSSFSSLKFWIEHLYNSYKIILFFIFLSCYQRFISNPIYAGYRSLKHTSTPSRLIFVHPRSSYHHQFRAPRLDSHSTTPNRPATSPSPLSRDVGSNSSTSVHSGTRTRLHPPLPFPQGCGRLKLARRRNWGVETRRGTQEVGGPDSASPKRTTTFVVVRFSPLPFPFPPH
jgi:hypothetical protein